MSAQPKIFIIGFSRCGTVSFHSFFEKAGLRSVHCDEGRLAVTMKENVLAGRRVIAGYEDYDVFSDMYYTCLHGIYQSNEYFREIAHQEPDAKFILNVRDMDKWTKSMSYWHEVGWGPYPDDVAECDPPACRLEFVEAYRRHFAYSSTEQVISHWRMIWRNHLADVKEYLPPDRLLVYDIEKDDPVDVCRFVGFPDDFAMHWEKHNRSVRDITTKKLAIGTPRLVRKLLPRSFKDFVLSVMYRIENKLRA